MARQPSISVNATESDLNGSSLYGDDFPPDQIAKWYAQEETGYLDLMTNYYRSTDSQGNYEYEYEALNRFHAFKLLSTRQYSCCVALGCAAGDDVAPLSPVVQEFVGIEPAEKWWRSEIGGKPARYIKPTVIGDIPLDANSVELATSFGVLHHIPNVSHVIGEIARVLRPGSLFVVREPISWMGDWRRPRPGLTRNERGIPLKWFERTASEKGFRIIRRRLCTINGLSAVANRLGLSRPFSRMPFVAVDWIASECLRWNLHYRRDTTMKKVAPGSAFWILQRLPD